jgi:hypothetical protein
VINQLEYVHCAVRTITCSIIWVNLSLLWIKVILFTTISHTFQVMCNNFSLHPFIINVQTHIQAIKTPVQVI